MNVLEDAPYVEFLLLADRAEAINGKLYLMGGGWDRLWVGDFGQTQTISFAVGIVVPWSATHGEYRLTIIMTDDDETEVGSAQLGFRPGAPAQMERTESQKVLAAMTMQPKIERPGTYTLRAMINDDMNPERSRSTTFFVKQRPVVAH
jgi:hypothetical protein